MKLISSRKYGFNVFNHPPEEFFEYASQYNLNHIEINLTQSHSSIESFSLERIENLRRLSERHDVSLSIHLPFKVNISDIIKVIRNDNLIYLKKCINFAQKIDATHITIHIGNFYWFPVETFMRKKALDRFIKNLKEVLELSNQQNVTLALENVVPLPHGSDYFLLGDNISDFDYIFGTVQCENLKFCLDTGHANIGEGVLEYLKNFSQYLISVHYHDNFGKNDDHLPIGEGNIAWADVAKELNKLNYCGPLISECRNTEAHKTAELFESFFNGIEQKI